MSRGDEQRTDHVDRLYNAIRAFDHRMTSEEFIARIRVAPGDGVLIDIYLPQGSQVV